MKYTNVSFIFCLILFSFCLAVTNDQNREAKLLAEADSMFESAMFDESLVMYEKVLEINPDSYRANLQAGNACLLSNKFFEAEKYLTRAIKVDAGSQDAKRLLAELYYRQDRFRDAAPVYREIGNEGKALQLESFRDKQPYLLQGDKDETSISFMMTDPLPILKMSVNGKEIIVLLDTGGPELIIDSDLAKEIGAEVYGSGEGTFAGGRKGQFHYGSVDSVKIGEFIIKNVPVHMMPTRRMLRLGDLQLNGIIGTVFLYHFIPTIDYPGGKLILRKPSAIQYDKVAKEDGNIKVPFWMAGDHFMVSRGTVNKSDPMMLLVDTGLAGGAFTLSKAAIDEVGITIDENNSFTGMGGGGPVKAYRIAVDEITLGTAKEKNLSGVFFGDIPLADRFGFKIKGVVSHGFFRGYAVTFDFKGMWIYLSK